MYPRVMLKFEGTTRVTSTASQDSCPKLLLRVMVTALKYDATFGEARLPLDFPDLIGEAQEKKVMVMRHGRGQGFLRLRVSSRASKAAKKIVLSSRNFKLAEVAHAFAQVLSGEDGLATMEDALHALQLADESRASEQAKLLGLLRSLSMQAGMLSESLPDADVLERLARLSHSVQQFIASLLVSGPRVNADEVEDLAERWIKEIVSRVMKRSGMLFEGTMTEERLKGFVRQGRKFPSLADIVPVDRHFRPIPNWVHWYESSIPKTAFLSRGIQGCVYRAINIINGERYAVKDSQDLWGGEQPIDSRERELTDHLLMAPHPCLVRLFGCFYEHRRTFIIMELCARGDLAGIIQEQHSATGYVPPPEATQWIGDIFLGLEHLHLSLHVLMRDLKPHNVVVNSAGRAKVTDYGHSRIGLEAGGGFTLHPAPPGTPEYIAPEVALMRPYTFLSDLYSFGVLIWVLLTGGTDENGFPPCEIQRPKDTPGSYKYLAKNWQLLHRHVREPFVLGVRPMPSQQSADLVLSLTQETPAQRPSHEALRLDAFMRGLQLPPMLAPSQDVERWIAPGVVAAPAPQEQQPPPPAG